GKDWEQVRVKTRKWQRAGGGGVSGQRQETHGRTRQTQQAHDNINKQGKDWEQVRVKTRKWQRAGGGGVSGQRQETHGRTRQKKQAHDNINKQEKANFQAKIKNAPLFGLWKQLSINHHSNISIGTNLLQRRLKIGRASCRERV